MLTKEYIKDKLRCLLIGAVVCAVILTPIILMENPALIPHSWFGELLHDLRDGLWDPQVPFLGNLLVLVIAGAFLAVMVILGLVNFALGILLLLLLAFVFIWVPIKVVWFLMTGKW